MFQTDSIDVVSGAAQAVGNGLAAIISAKLAMLFGFIVKWVTEFTKPLLAKYAALSKWHKRLIVFGWAQIIAILNTVFMLHNVAMPVLPFGVEAAATAISGAIIGGLAIGFNTLKDVIFKKTDH